ncbi:Fumarate reductase, flavoprotein subunit precursor [Streptococcus thermophilus]|jgi:NAD(P)H-dependent FMN reductase|nr:oxidoreductase, putative, truncated [Streptococcus thermophilus LMG 18311]AAV63343.1 oxidoreductase, putative, truncated [Streptococcus thermophilus CNRZ1066]CAD0120612.1 Fumarate reductase, flavoprotein subunit precursor [Streptococcus thermophilus]CAD0128748.1 Fumarate reductase, flavoprotein subunit precursor [Streptococcus thermophilus]CAD0128983.1 Fumarate reductase, flavoprotein subunit precursor [Streptococcus thermophilus]
MKFVGLVGANYDQSYNRKLLEFIRRHFKIKFELEVLEIDEVPMFNQYEKLEKPKKPLTLRVTLPMKVLLTSLNNA